MPLKIFYPFEPFAISQAWGNLNPAYSQQFNDPSFKRHNGIDARPSFNDATTSYNPKTWPVHCPVEGFVVETVSFEQNGGGNQISLISKQKVQVGDKLCYARIWLLHADKVLVPVGYEPKLGELITIGDNTGFSTGPHTHMGLYRLDDNKNKIDQNEATGSYNPAGFFTGVYAADVATYATLFKSVLRYYQYRVGLSG